MISDKLNAKKFFEEDLCPSYEGKTLNIEITSKCNEKCIYCQYEVNGSHGKMKNIDSELFYRVTKEAYELGITDVGLYLSGEPLMNPNVYDYVKYLKDLGFSYVYISTNGLLCTPENLRKLAEAGIDSIKFSLAGATRENFMKHHGVDAFELVRDNVRYAYEYRKQSGKKYALYAFCILTRFNKDEEDLMRQEYGPYVDEIMFVNVLDHIIPIRGFREYLMMEEDVKSDYKPRVTLPCPIAFNTIAVDEDGYLQICCFKSKSAKVADLNKVSLKEGLYSDAFVSLRRRHVNKDVKGLFCEACCTRNGENMKEIKTLIDMDDNVEVVEHLDATDEIKKRFFSEGEIEKC